MEDITPAEKTLAVVCIGIALGIIWAAAEILGWIPRPRELATVTPMPRSTSEPA